MPEILAGYRLIAVSEIGNSESRCYINKSEGKFLFVVDETVIGPLTKHQLNSFHHVLNDVIEMKGRFFFLE